MNGKSLKIFALTLLIAAFALAACDAVAPAAQAADTPNATHTPIPTGTETPEVVFITRTPTRTRVPSLTPDLTWVAGERSRISTQSVFETEIAEFPDLCPSYASVVSRRVERFSPDGLWFGKLCLGGFDDEGQRLIFSNKETGVVWEMYYIDFLGEIDFADGAMGITHWSKDSRYVYFYSTIGGSCGECFYEGYDVGAGLFRLDLFTGETSEVLPPNTVFYWYCFSIAPTGRFLVYSEVFHNLKILDMNTGQTINIVHKKDFRNRGGYVWSPDGLRFAFSSVSYNLEETEREGYSLHLVDAQTGEERILLESKTSCYLVKEWRENNVLVVEYNDENYARAIMEYDLNTDSILGNPPPSIP